MSGPFASSSLVLVSAGVDIGVQMFVSTLSTVVWLTRSLQNPLKMKKKSHLKIITLIVNPRHKPLDGTPVDADLLLLLGGIRGRCQISGQPQTPVPQGNVADPERLSKAGPRSVN